jgi:hypothetical protein
MAKICLSGTSRHRTLDRAFHGHAGHAANPADSAKKTVTALGRL